MNLRTVDTESVGAAMTEVEIAFASPAPWAGGGGGGEHGAVTVTWKLSVP